MWCAKCGKKNKEQANFCAKCGSPIGVVTETSAENYPPLTLSGETFATPNEVGAFLAKPEALDPDKTKYASDDIVKWLARHPLLASDETKLSHLKKVSEAKNLGYAFEGNKRILISRLFANNSEAAKVTYPTSFFFDHKQGVKTSAVSLLKAITEIDLTARQESISNRYQEVSSFLYAEIIPPQVIKPKMAEILAWSEEDYASWKTSERLSQTLTDLPKIKAALRWGVISPENARTTLLPLDKAASDTTLQSWQAKGKRKAATILSSLAIMVAIGSAGSYYFTVYLPNQDANLWAQAQSSKTIDDYQAYIDNGRDSHLVREAKTQLETVVWNNTLASAKKDQIEAYLENYPIGQYREKATQIIEDWPWKQAELLDTQEAYELFIENNSNHPRVIEARQKIEALVFQTLSNKNTPAALNEYLNLHPNGRYVNVAREQIDKIYWEAAQEKNTVVAYEAFIADRKNSKFRKDALIKIDDIRWASAKTANTKSAFENYLKRETSGRNSAEAKERVSTFAWEALANSQNLKQHLDVLRQDPSGSYSVKIKEKVIRQLKSSVKTAKNMEQPWGFSGNIVALDGKKRTNEAYKISVFDVMSGVELKYGQLHHQKNREFMPSSLVRMDKR